MLTTLPAVCSVSFIALGWILCELSDTWCWLIDKPRVGRDLWTINDPNRRARVVYGHLPWFICYILHSNWFFGNSQLGNQVQSTSKDWLCLALLEWRECCKQNSCFTFIKTDKKSRETVSWLHTKKHQEAKQSDNYTEWHQWCNENCPKTKPLPVLSFLNKWFLHYVVETQGKKVSTSYTIHSLLGGLQHHTLSLNPAAARFLDKKNSFKHLASLRWVWWATR